MDQIPPEVRRSIAELSAVLSNRRLPVHIAAATLPVPEEIRQALGFWYEHIPLVYEAAGETLPGFFVSLAADLSHVTWHAAGETPRFSACLAYYLDEIDFPEENLADLNQVLDTLQPSRLGGWITGRKDSYDLGWYLTPPGGRLESALPLLPESPDLHRLAGWAERYGVSDCVRLGRSLASDELLSEVALEISAETPRRAVEIGMRLLPELGLADPPDEILEAALRQTQANIFASLWLGQGGAVKFGLLLPQPSTELVLRLCDAAGPSHENELAIFEASLGSQGPAYAEPQQLASGWGVELHYAIQGER